MANPEMSDQMPDSPADDGSGIAAASPATLPSETAQLQQLLAEAREGEREARRALGVLASIIKHLPVGVTVQAEDGKPLFANDMAAEFSSPVPGLAPNTAAPGSGEGASAQVSIPTVTMTEDRVAGTAGERTLLKYCRPARIHDRAVLVTAAIDHTERKQAEVELSRRAYFDDLTGLPNRTLIQEHVEQLLTSPETSPRFALAFLDIDNFKHINDYYTHAIGDALLVKVAQRIATNVRPSDILSRISGDEFLLVVHPLACDEDLAALIDSLLQQLKEPFLIEGFEIFTSASIGLSVYPDHGRNYEMLRRAADTAMYRIKEGAKGGAALFDSDMGRAMTKRMAQEQRLRLAVRDGRFCCAFQPKVDIRSEEVVGVEALIRLRDENGEIHAPGDFIGLATELGLIDDMAHLALDQIVRSMDLIDEAFGPHVTVSINIAAKQACNIQFMRDFCDELKSTSYADRFIVEVTEDAFVAKSLFQSQVLPMLREIGTRVSIDDFGTGYSSLAALADITADELKIDRSFITDIHKRSRSQSILKAIEALSEPLGMTVIAEGVETPEEVAFLKAATRIRYAQGYYYSRPIFMEDLTTARHGGSSNSRSHATQREQSPLRARR
jgi:diguanylate cyclase (GGDEF)-like protein